MQWLSLCFTELKQFTSLNHTRIDSVNGTWPSDRNVCRLSTCYPSLPHHLPCHPKLHFCCTGWFWWTTFLSSSAQNLELISVLPSYLCPYLVDEFFCGFMFFPGLILLHHLDQHPEIFCSLSNLSLWLFIGRFPKRVHLIFSNCFVSRRPPWTSQSKFLDCSSTWSLYLIKQTWYFTNIACNHFAPKILRIYFFSCYVK